MTPALVIQGLWLAWVVSWFAAAWWSKPVAKQAGIGRELLYRLVIIAGAVLLIPPQTPIAAWDGRLWPLTPAQAWTVAALITIGFLFTWWARLHLGSLWSSNVTRKEEHRIVDSGPYALVRHPIYTGLMFALAVTSTARATVAGFIGAALMLVGFYLKAKLEERFLREELGTADYDAYAARVPMLVPFWK